MARINHPCVVATLMLATGAVTLGAQKAGDAAGSITTIDARSGLVTVAGTGEPTQRYEFTVSQVALRTRLHPGQPVTLNLKTATGQLGGQTLRIRSVLTQISVTPRVRTAQLCAALEAAMNASLGEAPPGIPTVLWTCVTQPVPDTNQYWCRCTPQFSF